MFDNLFTAFFKLPHIRLVAGVIFIFSSVFAPLLFHYQFNRSAFEHYDLVRLFSISFAMGFPFTVWHSFWAFQMFYDQKYKEGWYVASIFGSFITIMIFYIPMAALTGVYTDKSLLFASKTIRYAEFGITILFVINTAVVAIRNKRDVLINFFQRDSKVDHRASENKE